MAKSKPNFDTIRERANRLVKEHASRDSMYKAMADFLFLEWNQKPPGEHIKDTMSPDPYNQIMGIVRLMISTDPVISVAADDTDEQSAKRADRQEKALSAIWTRTNRRRRWSVHYDAALSATLFSEVALNIANMSETIKWAEVQGQDAGDMKRYARECPYMINVVNPTSVYPEFGAFGLRSLLNRYRRPAWQVREFWGNKAAGLDDIEDDDEKVWYNDYWTHGYRCVWTDKNEQPVFIGANELPFIPWVVTIATGTGLFNEPHRQRFPFLYPVWKSKIWQRQNLGLTILYTASTQMSNPTWVVVTADGRAIPIDLAQMGGQIDLRTGESITPLQRELIDPSVLKGLEIANGKMESSTLPQVVFGQAPGSTMSFSAINMLTQGGRLPLVPIERQVGRAIAEAFETILLWIHHANESVKLYNTGRLAEIGPEDINPDHIEVDVRMKADIPQDRLQLANVVSMLINAKGADGLPVISSETARGYLGFMQPGDEQERILQELFIRQHLMEFIQQEAERSQMDQDIARYQAEQAQQPPGPGGPGFNPGMGGAPPVMAGPPGPPPMMMPGGPGEET